ncbi:hypothetical protein BCB4_0254 [Bacillus phage B4]|uniref:Uncharacterized protein n=2 Tax=Bequatrovirus B4 TaxID=1918005 RepID=J9PQK5_9CAUD|nr:hypothetical protein BCB4_0254 [Bacillus phage B4]YP_009783845.1 hypothetical protein QLX26_gp249 [Bacillus phage B5S]MEB9013835.1 hypothetical protein [Bacillus cereus]AEW47483.1 hypothetical protein B5S_0249 [Bacillus phage B5S]AEZ66047.1 hypothetical protein BCB4_0254 [Bacillus phage B4]MEB9190550.1 hypothetical protein [Bacillus cereus]
MTNLLDNYQDFKIKEEERLQLEAFYVFLRDDVFTDLPFEKLWFENRTHLFRPVSNDVAYMFVQVDKYSFLVHIHKPFNKEFGWKLYAYDGEQPNPDKTPIKQGYKEL